MPADDPFLRCSPRAQRQAEGRVHSHCGFPIKTALDLSICMDLKPGDRFLWMSDMGWLVGPMLVFGGLLVGATVVLAEGAPNYPQPDRLWRLVERHRVSYLGLAPTIARLSMSLPDEAGRATPARRVMIPRRALDARGPALTFERVEVACRRLISAARRWGHPDRHGDPSARPAFGAVPGTGADVVDATNGASVDAGVTGELVMRTPTIGLTRGLWHDRERYLESYWSRLPDLWVQGDFASRDVDGMWYVHGRSDDTLKIAGKRTGPAEIEALLMGTGLLEDAVTIGVPDPIKGTALVCLCVARPETDRDTAVKALSAAVTAGLGGAFKPADVVFVPDLPRTRK